MKIIICFALAALILLCSCSTSKQIVSVDSNDIIANGSEKTIPKATPSPEPTNIKLKDNAFTFTPEDIRKAIDTDNNFTVEQPYTYDDYKAVWYRNNYQTIKILTFCNPEQNNVYAVSLITSGQNDTILNLFLKYFTTIYQFSGIEVDSDTMFSELISSDNSEKLRSEQGYSEVIYNDVACRYIVDTDEKQYILQVFPANTDLDVDTLPTKIKRNNDFFTSEETQKVYDEYLENHNYSKILELADNYINQSNPNESDSAFTIKSEIQPAVEAMSKCEAVKDEFSNAVFVYYKGLTKIDTNNNFVTFVKDNHYVKYRLGFQAKDWMLFDSFTVKADDILIKKNSASEVREVLDNEQILEYVDISFYDSDLEALLNSENISIRFKGKDDKTYDHTLSPQEIDAIKVMNVIGNTNKNLSNLKFRWINN